MKYIHLSVLMHKARTEDLQNATSAAWKEKRMNAGATTSYIRHLER